MGESKCGLGGKRTLKKSSRSKSKTKRNRNWIKKIFFKGK